MSRRELLGLCAASYFSVQTRERLTPAARAADHLLLGIADLDKGIEWVEKTTGVKAVIGGSHPGVGTRNALVALGDRRYLEIIAPDPAQTSYASQFDVRKLPEPRLITWAAATTGIAALAAKARDAGQQTFGPRDGSRARPDGKLLKWRSLGVQSKLAADGIEPIPFFIEWAADSVHPSQDSPRGCRLLSLELEHPDPAAVRKMLGSLGISIEVKQSGSARLKAVLDTPKGKVTLS